MPVKFHQKSFSIGATRNDTVSSDEIAKRWEETFGKKEVEEKGESNSKRVVMYHITCFSCDTSCDVPAKDWKGNCPACQISNNFALTATEE